MLAEHGARWKYAKYQLFKDDVVLLDKIYSAHDFEHIAVSILNSGHDFDHIVASSLQGTSLR